MSLVLELAKSLLQRVAVQTREGGCLEGRDKLKKPTQPGENPARNPSKNGGSRKSIGEDTKNPENPTFPQIVSDLFPPPFLSHTGKVRLESFFSLYCEHYAKESERVKELPTYMLEAIRDAVDAELFRRWRSL